MTVQVIQIVAGGMHSVAVSQDGEVFTTGVNDEAALGRKTGVSVSLLRMMIDSTCILTRREFLFP